MSDEIELWTWAVSVYDRPSVPRLCLRLQDEFGFDVNVALACVWAAKSGWAVTNDDLTAMLDSTVAERRRVEQLRVVRRDAKGAPDSDRFYRKLKEAELEGEKVVQRRLWSWLSEHGRTAGGLPSVRALNGLRAYAAHRRRWPEASVALRDLVDAVLD